MKQQAKTTNNNHTTVATANTVGNFTCSTSTSSLVQNSSPEFALSKNNNQQQPASSSLFFKFAEDDRRATTSQLDDDSPIFINHQNQPNIQHHNNNIHHPHPHPSSATRTRTRETIFTILSYNTISLTISSPTQSEASQRLSLASSLSPTMIFNEQELSAMNNNGLSMNSPGELNNSSKSRWSKLKSAFKRESKQQPSADRLKSFQQQYGDSAVQNYSTQVSNNNIDVASHSFAALPSSASNHSSLIHSSKSSPSLYNTTTTPENYFRESISDSNNNNHLVNHLSPHHAPSSSNSSMTSSVNSVISFNQFLQSSSSGNSIVSPMSSSTLSSVGVLENPMITTIMNGDSSRFSPPLSHLIVDSGRGTTTSPPSPFSENLTIQTHKRVTSPLSIQSSGNEMIIQKQGLTENYNVNNNTSPYTPPTPNENSDEPALQTTRKTKGNIKKLISMLTPRRKKSTSSKSEPSKATQSITSPSNEGDPALLDVAHKRKLFEKRSSTEASMLKDQTPKTPRAADDEQIQRLVNEKIVSSKIQQFIQNEESISLSQRKYSVSGKIANWLKNGNSENRLSRSFTDEKKDKRKSVFDFGKREYDLTPVIATTSPSDTPTLSNSTNEKLKRLINKHHSANTPYTNPLSTLLDEKEKSPEEEEPIPPPTLSSTPRNLVPTLNFNNEEFKRTTEDIINGNISSLLSNDSAYSFESSEDTSSSLQVSTVNILGSIDNLRATVTSPTGALSPGSQEYNTTIAPEYEVGDDEESIVTVVEYIPLTNFGEVKPKQLYSFVLEQFINNHNLDDQKCAEYFENFIIGYLAFCKEADESKNEELKEFANFSEHDIPKMRDFEKPKCYLLHQSAKKNRSSLIFLLVTKYQCSIDAEDELESTPLHWATSHRAIDSILVLCQLGGKINIRDKYGKAPIHLLFAKAFYDEEHFEMETCKVKDKPAAEKICRYLLQNGANPDVKDNKHQTPRMLAAENDLQISFGKKRK
ncbi:predicted protein [Naegleria gruberi]|uniref:Predicted protein n=1 Tax=Naegleria gruberi TaxID=5762 RepID=D2VKZ0_NAEGR|nr:uncharacterized protein NAEGRDRAFT_80388 [Naegleria gruberi]EFC42528.1 predicted protein [Naegleria gruberi]|eukprot:XP_002675272.1 predicted protein [Naegleria gruberi strain NEG-M]